MLLGSVREDLPDVIVRPSIVTSTFEEPFPGWIEGTRYAKLTTIISKSIVSSSGTKLTIITCPN
jgi:hypothetical protein